MTDLPIPLQVLYAGLAGTVLALIVATIQNKWSMRVFFILALRLAIGWHFLFEGLHKIHSTHVGPSETNKVFSSEPYFQVAEGPLGPIMRKQMSDVEASLKARLTPPSEPEHLVGLSGNSRAAIGPGKLADEDYARMVPAEVARDWQNFVAAFIEKYKLSEEEKRRLDGKLDDAERAELAAAKEFDETADAKKKKELATKVGPGDLSIAALAAYGRWVVGVEGRNSAYKFVSGDVPLTAPQRKEYIANREVDLDRFEERTKPGLGNGSGIDLARVREARTLVMTARAALLADADAFLKELEKDTFTTVTAGRLSKQAPPPSKALDKTEQFAAILPPGKAPDAATFDAVPEPIRKVWDAGYTAFKNDYPDAAGEKLDEAFALAKTRLANWYFDRDEFSGLKKAGFTTAAGKYSKARLDAARVEDAAKKVKVSEAATALDKAIMQAAANQAFANADAAREASLTALDTKFADLKKSLAQAIPTDLTDGPLTAPPNTKKEFVEKLDRNTRWGIMAIGALLLAGLFTRLACLAGGVFLVMTYLTHPPFPWLALPPGTEGNPVFVNKNVIEFLGLMVVLVHPTGRWMGLDSIVHKLLFRKAPDPT